MREALNEAVAPVENPIQPKSVPDVRLHNVDEELEDALLGHAVSGRVLGKLCIFASN